MPTLSTSTLDGLPGPTAGRMEVFHWDDQVRGFGIRIRASGRRYWVVQFRVGSAIRRVTLGDLQTLTLKDARTTARRMLAQARLGHDPRLEIEARKSTMTAKPELTVAGLAELYLSRAAERRLKPRSLVSVRRSLLDLTGPLHATDAAALNRRDVAQLLQRVAMSNGPRTADLVASHLSTMFRWAIGTGLLEVDPAAHMPKQDAAGSRDRCLTDAELALVWRALGRRGDYVDVLRLLILTGQRRDEVGGMRWSEVDRARAVWTIPRSRTKNGRAHEVPLADSALTILDARERWLGRDLVFGTGTGGFAGWSAAKRRLDAAIARLAVTREAHERAGGAGIQPWRVHDLRRTAVTGMVTIGVLPHVVEAVVNHVSGHRAGVAGIYNRATYAAEKRDALTRWAAHVEAVIQRALPSLDTLET